jgi:hypothetical protein
MAGSKIWAARLEKGRGMATRKATKKVAVTNARQLKNIITRMVRQYSQAFAASRRKFEREWEKNLQRELTKLVTKSSRKRR